jgi:N-dimethylarginine dimethylaminohydrolase
MNTTTNIVIFLSEAKALVEYMERHGINTGIIRFQQLEDAPNMIFTTDCKLHALESQTPHNPDNPFYTFIKN